MGKWTTDTVIGNLIKFTMLPVRFFFRLRTFFEVKYLGHGCRVIGPVYISGGKNIRIGRNCFFGRNVVLDATGGHLEIGDRCEIRDGARIYAESVRIGSDVTIGENSFLVGKINIGDKAWIARNCDLAGEVLVEQAILGPGVSCVGGADHPRDPVTHHVLMKHDAPLSQIPEKPWIRISQGAWVGQNAIILKGVQIGEGAIVGAGSVVSRSVRPLTTVAGNPAREIKKS
ncbi:MAG: DapH/DapD/GlmU-related protein [Candidatus Omnitrophota bacterium]|jgi:acetyltransferase-like isoleucine patch superfamily enzyme